MTASPATPATPVPRIPARVDDIDGPWLEAALAAGGTACDAPVTRVERRVIGAEKGFLSATARIAIEYARPDAGPASLVVKIEPSDPTFRDAGRRCGAFAREVRFYDEMARSLPLRLPHVYFATARDDGSALVMEDLTALECADQVHGLSHHQVLATVRHIARLHAAYWDNDALRALGWMPEHDHFFDQGFAQHWPAFARTYELRIGREALRLGERVVARLPWLEERIASRPATVIHGDLRADNLLFARDGDPGNEPVLLDWQLANRSLAAIDVARLLGGSEPAAERRGHQLEVCVAWHEALVAAGVSGYSREAALDDFRLAALYCLVIPVRGLYLVGDAPGARTARLIDAMAERFYASALELDAGALLD
jgi:aminoglycoside phosphotransferase (APT) family kinase protein